MGRFRRVVAALTIASTVGTGGFQNVLKRFIENGTALHFWAYCVISIGV